MTPQMQLTLSSIFDGKSIRATEINGEIWIPVVDLADAWEVDRTTLTKIINKNPDIFKTLSTVIELPSSREISSNPQSVNNSLRLVNERGTVILALKVSAKDLKNPIAKEKVIEFQLWIPQIIQDLRKGMVQLTVPQQPVHMLPVQSPLEILKEQFTIAKAIAEETGIPKEQAQTYAVVLAGERAGIDLHCYASAIKAKSNQLQLTEAIPTDQVEFDSYFSLSQVASFLKLPENKVRNVMESMNIIYLEHGNWKVTKYGEQYAKSFLVSIGYPYRNIKKSWIRYNPAALELLKKYFNVEIPAVKVSE